MKPSVTVKGSKTDASSFLLRFTISTRFGFGFEHFSYLFVENVVAPGKSHNQTIKYCPLQKLSFVCLCQAVMETSRYPVSTFSC